MNMMLHTIHAVSCKEKGFSNRNAFDYFDELAIKNLVSLYDKNVFYLGIHYYSPGTVFSLCFLTWYSSHCSGFMFSPTT